MIHGVTLWAYSQGVNGETPEDILKRAFSQCYQRPASIKTIQKNMKHQSVFEHVSFTFDMVMSRVAWEQQVRHRIASYTAQSHRYTEIELEDTWVYIPSEIKEDEVAEWKEDCQTIFSIYQKWIAKKKKKETARYMANKGVGISVTVTMNLRSLINFLTLRTDPHAQEEIRILANMVWNEVKPLFPSLQADLERLFGKGH